MQKRALLTIILLSLFIIPIVNAEILISETNEVYNFGDSFSVSIILAPSTYASEYLIANLICNAQSVEIYKSPHTLAPLESKQVDISFSLDSFLVSGLEGNCEIQTTFGTESSSSRKFTLTKEIFVSLSLEKADFNPGEEILITGTATKANSQPLEGFVEISLQGTDTKAISLVNAGTFQSAIIVPEKTPAGTQSLDILVYEKDENEETINEGSAIKEIKINQIPTSIDVALDSVTIAPGSELKYKVLILDQTGNEMTFPVNLKLVSPSGKVLSESEVSSSDDLVLSTETNYIPGEWIFQVSSDALENNRKFTIDPLPLLSYEVQDDRLKVTNIGNVVYDQPLEIKISDKTESFDINLSPGKSKFYQLSAPTGDYDIELASSQGASSLSSVALTGSAISIDDITLGIKSKTLNLIIWAIVLIVLIIAAIILYRKVAKKDFTGKTPKLSNKTTFKDISNENYQDTQSGNIAEGKKQHASIIALKIKNQSEIENNQEAIKSIDSALLKAKGEKAKIYVSENYRIVIFAKAITGEANNNLIAAAIANQIKETLNTHNRSSKTKIKYGIAIHVGELITESKENKFRFTSIGNTISTVKNMAETSNSQILISEAFREKTIGKIKAEKVSSKVFKMQELKSRHKYDEFIKRFEEKQRKNKG
ncbi:hypothetical protein CMI45_02825 [Candidatus Pacearchaeota archaeon]|nr:hypothetical protein [Candidatus Pacearchaeota archaeon]|tara:strand:+ start:3986 stop:5950 length:1965 start_codon:yes stop_codon:yes gene_type:complete